jgi:hypothetical protein
MMAIAGNTTFSSGSTPCSTKQQGTPGITQHWHVQVLPVVLLHVGARMTSSGSNRCWLLAQGHAIS